MARKISLVLLIFLSVDHLHAQYGKWSISVSAGMAAPLGKFGAKNLNDVAGAYAEPGEAVNLGLNYQLTTHFGLAALFRYQENKVDTKSMEAKSLNGIPRSVYNIQFISDKWKIANFMAGGYYSHSLGNKFHISVALLAGLLKTSVPRLTELNTQYETVFAFNGTSSSVENDTTTTSITRNNYPLKWTFSYGAAGSLRYRLKKNWTLLSLVDYSFSNPVAARKPMPVVISTKTPTGTTSSSGTVIPTGSLNYNRPLASLAISLGLELNL